MESLARLRLAQLLGQLPLGQWQAGGRGPLPASPDGCSLTRPVTPLVPMAPKQQLDSFTAATARVNKKAELGKLYKYPR